MTKRKHNNTGTSSANEATAAAVPGLTPLHQETEAAAGHQPAVAIAMELIDQIVVGSLRRAAEAFAANNVLNGADFNVAPEIEIAVVDISVQPSDLHANAVPIDWDRLRFDFQPNFSFVLALRYEGDSTLEFSRIPFTIADGQVECTAEDSWLRFGQPNATTTTAVQMSATRAAAIAAAGIAEVDVVRAEAAFGVILPEKIVQSLLATIPDFNLRDLFPSVELLGRLGFHMTATGHLLVIPEDGISLIAPPGCPRVQVEPDADFELERRTGTGQAASWRYRNPVFPAPAVRPPRWIDGHVALYMPHTLVKAEFGTILPSLTYRSRGGGMIGYAISITVRFASFGVTIDPATASVRVDIEFLADGRAEANVDVPCVGRQKVAAATVEIARSTLVLRLAFDVNRDGRLVVVPSVEDMRIGQVTASVRFFQRFLALAGGGGFIEGFILDTVIARVLENNIPIKIRERLREEVRSRTFPLADLGEMGSYLRNGLDRLGPTFSANAASMLLGIHDRQG
jgi:hypothetical protein